MDTALDTIREYYPEAEVKPVMFRGERIGYGVFLEDGDDDAVVLASDKRSATTRAVESLRASLNIP